MTRRALVLACAAAVGCGSRHESARGAVGGAVASAITAALAAAAHERAAWRCAALDGPAPPAGPIVVGATTWTVDGRVARRAPSSPPRPVRIAFLADAEAPTAPTLAALGAIRARLATLGVGVIVTLGGMGGSSDELAATLGALADGAVLVVAIPGDREPAEGHRAAVAALAPRGVVDGSLVRWIVVGGVGIATLPGQPFTTRLAHGVEGCGHTDADAAAVLAAAPDGLRTRILASQRAPRHPDRGDQAALGVAAGDAGLAAALAGAAPMVDLVVHASLDGAPTPAGRLGDGLAMVATGVASASPRLDAAGRRLGPAAVVVTVEGSRLQWQPITP